MLWSWLGLACSGPTDHGGDPPPPATGDTAVAAALPSWESIPVAGLDPIWGSSSVGSWTIGGVGGSNDARVDVFSVDTSDSVVATPAASMQTARYCACALVDAGRQQLVVVGGRNAGFAEATTSERVDLVTGTSTPLDAGPAEHPVGCWAAFSDEQDRGWVFGGAGAGQLDGETWRFDPTDGSWTALGIPGPSPRYDAGLVQLPDGDVLLVGGMADEGFVSDVWRFDPATEAWTELATTSEEVPAGRRFPYVALAPDGEHLVYGYGTDSPMGTEVRRDLWSFALSTGTWTRLEVEGDKPAARSFTAMWPGPPGSAGVMAFGVDGDLVLFDDAWVLWWPE